MNATLSNMWKVLLVGCLAVAPASADVVRIEVQSRSDIVGGQAFGAAGPYEKISGKIFFAVDPGLPANRIVADLESAAKRRGQGRILVRLFSPQAQAHRARQRGRALRGLQSRRQGHARILQPWNREPRPGLGGRRRRRLPDEAGLYAALGRLAVRPAETSRARARVSADCVGKQRPTSADWCAATVVTERETDRSLADRDHTAYATSSGLSRQRDDRARFRRRPAPHRLPEPVGVRAH